MKGALALIVAVCLMLAGRACADEYDERDLQIEAKQQELLRLREVAVQRLRLADRQLQFWRFESAWSPGSLVSMSMVNRTIIQRQKAYLLIVAIDNKLARLAGYR